tara:strand:- start:383 stop:670 length:288 start_codon:yes stop_codon:yes gene_type:complete
MTFNKERYEQELNTALREYTVALNHIVTGAMHDSISFVINESEESFNVSLTSTDYIVYLDEGGFITNFFDLPSTQKIIEDLSESFGSAQLDKLFQ